MSCRKLEVAQATPDRIGALAPLFGRAFADEPMTHWSLGDRREAYALTLLLCLLFGTGTRPRVGVGSRGRQRCRCLGSTRLFRRVGCAPLESAADHRLDRRRRPPICRVLGLGGFPPPHGAALATGLDRRRSQRSRSGPWAQLIATGLALARADGVGAFLSTGTARNVTIYGRSGFRVVDEADAPDGGPRIYFMRWDP
jgi:hypothetical protein